MGLAEALCLVPATTFGCRVLNADEYSDGKLSVSHPHDADWRMIISCRDSVLEG